MLEGQGPESIAIERGGQLVIGKGKVLGRRREPPLESREVEDRLAAILADPSLDDPPGVLELPEVVPGAGQDPTPGVRELRFHAHLRGPEV